MLISVFAARSLGITMLLICLICPDVKLGVCCVVFVDSIKVLSFCSSLG